MKTCLIAGKLKNKYVPCQSAAKIKGINFNNVQRLSKGLVNARNQVEYVSSEAEMASDQFKYWLKI